MKDAIKDGIDNITRIAKDYRKIIEHDYKFDDAYGECSFYGKFHQAILSELSNLEKILSDEERRKYLELGFEFIDWADFYFQNNLNKNIDREEAKRNFEMSLSMKHRGLSMRDFLRKIKIWCEIRGYVYNPEHIMKMRSDTERKRNEIIWHKDTPFGDERVSGFYIGDKEDNNNQ